MLCNGSGQMGKTRKSENKIDGLLSMKSQSLRGKQVLLMIIRDGPSLMVIFLNSNSSERRTSTIVVRCFKLF